jgi:hypothetical protein
MLTFVICASNTTFSFEFYAENCLRLSSFTAVEVFHIHPEDFNVTTITWRPSGEVNYAGRLVTEISKYYNVDTFSYHWYFVTVQFSVSTRRLSGGDFWLIP